MEYKCEPCSKSFTGLPCYQQHLASEKHKKKMRLSSGICESEPPNQLSASAPVHQFHCHLCTVSFTGMDSYQKHVNSLEHAIMIQKKNNDLLSTSVSSTFTLKSEQNQLMEPKVSLTGVTKAIASYAECKPCQKQFSGPEPYQQHLASAGHKKKCGPSYQNIQNSEINPVVKNENIANYLPSVAPFAECKPCQKQFSGPEPYQQHLESAGHKKKCLLFPGTMGSDEIDGVVKNEKTIDDSLNISESSVSANNFSEAVSQIFAKCDICEMEFYEASAYQMHIVSDVHLKASTHQLHVNSFVENQNVFKCDICAMTFTGSVPYGQHLVSAGHKKKSLQKGKPQNLFSVSQLATTDTSSDSDLGNEQFTMNEFQNYYCNICKIQCSGPIPFNTHKVGREHMKKKRALIVEANIKKFKESGPLPYVGNCDVDSNFSNEVTSTVNFGSPHKNEMDVPSDDFKMNDLNMNINDGDAKISSGKYQMNVNDLIALPNLNIIPPEKLNVAVFSPDDEIVFSSLIK